MRLSMRQHREAAPQLCVWTLSLRSRHHRPPGAGRQDKYFCGWRQRPARRPGALHAVREATRQGGLKERRPLPLACECHQRRRMRRSVASIPGSDACKVGVQAVIQVCSPPQQGCPLKLGGIRARFTAQVRPADAKQRWQGVCVARPPVVWHNAARPQQVPEPVAWVAERVAAAPCVVAGVVSNEEEPEACFGVVSAGHRCVETASAAARVTLSPQARKWRDEGRR